MAIQYDTIVNKNFSKGEDTYSAKNNAQPGHTGALRNVDVNSSGTIQTRKGYERYFGQLPIRVTKIVHTGDSGGGTNGYIHLTLDDSQTIDLSTTPQGPIVVGGHLSGRGVQTTSGGYTPATVGGDFGDTTQWHWYDRYELVNRQTLSVGAATLSVSQASHGVSSPYIFCGMAESLASLGNTHNVVMPQNVEIDATTYDVSIDYIGSADPSTIEGLPYTGDGFFFFKEKSASAGSVYIDSNFSGTSRTILSTTHNLDNTHIGVRVFTLSGGVYTEVMPATLTINASGDVAMTFSSSVTAAYAVLTSCPIANMALTTSLTLNANNEIDIVSPGNDFCFYYVYARSGSTLTQVVPAAIVYDGDTSTTTIRYYLGGTAEQVEIYWEEADSVANVIRITDTNTTDVTSAGYTDENPSLVVYGIPHDNIYKDSTTKGGHTTHLDVYRSVGEERLIAGIGGNIYGAYTQAESGTTALMGAYYLHQRSRSNGISNMAPLFDVTGAAVSRSRGLVTDASISGNKAQISSIAYVSSGVMDVTLAFTGLDNSITDGGEIDLGKDRLTISNAGYVVNNGSFVISSIQSGGGLGDTSVVFRVANSGCVSADTDETNSGAEAGVFTDCVVLSDITDFRIIGAAVTSSILDEDTTYSIVAYSTANSEVFLDNITEAVVVPDGVLLFSGYTTSVLPIATTSGTATVENYVTGDTVSLTGFDRKFRIKSVNVNEDITDASVLTASGEATLAIGATDVFNEGDSVLIHAAAGTIPSGVYLINTVTTGTSITIDTSDVADGLTDTLTIVGKTIEIDESCFITDSTDSVSVSVEGRFLPFEAPIPAGDGDHGTVAETAYISHFGESDYEDMPTARSAMVADSLFVTDGVNSIKKIDGSNILQAGLPYWQPLLYSSWDTSVESITASAQIPFEDAVAAGKYFMCATGSFSVGDRIYYDDGAGATGIATIVDTYEDSLAHGSATTVHQHAIVDVDITAVDGASGTLTLITPRKYYARLNYLDTNDNVIASAATGRNDMIVEQTVAGRCKLRLLGLPDYGMYDYDKLELELYRTVGLVHGASETYYLVSRSIMNFATFVGGHIDIVDDMSDEELGGQPLDAIHGNLLGVERGVDWDSPKTAKYITSVDNRLVTANLSHEPTFNIQIHQPSGVATANDLSSLHLYFRKDNTNTSTTADMMDVLKFSTIASGNSTLKLKNTTTVSTKSSVNIGTDTVTTAAPHNLVTGDRVKYETTGTAIGGLADETFYWVIVTGASTFQLAETITLAMAGSPFDLTTDPAGTHTFTPYSNIEALSTEVTAYVYIPNHGITDKAWVYLTHSAVNNDNSLSWSGYYLAEEVDAHIISILGDTRSSKITDTINEVDTLIYGGAAYEVPVYMGTDGNYSDRQGNVSSFTTSEARHIFARRMTNAINSVMRLAPRYGVYYDSDSLGYTTYSGTLPNFLPWLRARSGGNLAAGQIIVDVVRPMQTTAEMRAWLYGGSYQLFCNGRRIAASTEGIEDVSARTYLFPSRVALSFPNYPEMTQRFVDINSADGQDITGIISFFGESVFGAGNALNQSVVVFKTHSIYLLDVTTGDYVKINSRGIGCTAPYSIAQTKNGIMFASSSGIYRLSHEMQVEYVGRMYEGNWKDLVEKDALSVAAGHYYSHLHQYKLSLPAVGATNQNSLVAVYRQDGEEPVGSFTTYTNHPSLMWANMGSEAFFASTRGLVMKIRNYADQYDYRDDDAAVAEQIITLKADDFGIPGVRKVVASIITSLDLTTDLTSVIIEAATNLSSTFTNCGTVNIDLADYTHTTFRASPAVRKGGYLQVRYRHSTIDECLIFTGVAFKVGRLDIQGTIETANLT